MFKKLEKQGIIALIVVLILSASAGAKMLIPGGHTIGMKAYAAGLVVTGVEDGSPAETAGIRQGDILRMLGGEPLKSAGQLIDRMTDGEELCLKVDRGEGSYEVSVQPEQKENQYRLGAFVRDNVAGIGTISYYDPENGSFGALGHGISDPGGAALLPITGGVVVPSKVEGVVKGRSGAAGQLKGEFDPKEILGEIRDNTNYGVFGTLTPPNQRPIPVASADEVHPGAAIIHSNVDGNTVEQFDIQILKCYGKKTSEGRNMLIKVTDPKLLETTGGIVQGMSGSPILQDGKLVGAVTHVLVNEPHVGYGIYMENMLEAAS